MPTYPPQKDELYNEYITLNKSYNDLCAQYNIGVNLLKKWLRENGIRKPRYLQIKNAEKNCICKHGYKNPMQRKDIKEKARKTYQARTGYSSPLQNPEIRDKGIQYIKTHRKEIQDRVEKTNREKYGVNRPIQSEDIKKRVVNKFKQTITNNPDILKRRVQSYRDSHQNKFGAQYHIQNFEIYTDARKLKEYICSTTPHKTMFDLMDFFNVKRAALNIQLHKFGLHDLVNRYCSCGEKEMGLLVKKICGKIPIMRNTRQIIPPYELDIYIPSLHLAFEYNGEYWHREGETKPLGYHKMKSDLCREQGITLIHVWESDWLDNQDEVKQRLQEIMRKKI